MRPTEPFDLTTRAERQVSTTSPIYVRDTEGTMHGVGTALFFAHRGHKFVLTASHVLRDYMNTHELIVAGETAIRLNQRWFRPPDEDAYDVAFVPLSDEQASTLGGARFVTIDEVELSAADFPQPHYILGYRSDDNEPDGPQENVVAGWSVYAVRSAAPGTYEARGVSREDQLLLMFDRRALLDYDGPVDPEPAPEGMSGSGVWVIGSEPISDRLAGIVGSHSDRGSLVYASRLAIAMASLDHFVDGTIS